MFRERTDASLRTLLMVIAAIGLVASIASPIAIRASRAAMPRAAASLDAARTAQQDYHRAASLVGVTLVAPDAARTKN